MAVKSLRITQGVTKRCSNGFPAQEKRDDPDDEENEEADLGDPGCGTGNSREAEDTGY
jgi:hypothetical protein